MRLSAEVRDTMAIIRKIAMASEWAICWICGGRPADGRWEADHVMPLLGAKGPLAAACRYCNRKKGGKIVSSDASERLFWSRDVVRSVGADELRLIAQQESTRLFGHTGHIETLLAAVDGKKRVLNKDKKGDKAANEALSRLKSAGNGS